MERSHPDDEERNNTFDGQPILLIGLPPPGASSYQYVDDLDLRSLDPSFPSSGFESMNTTGRQQQPPRPDQFPSSSSHMSIQNPCTVSTLTDSHGHTTSAAQRTTAMPNPTTSGPASSVPQASGHPRMKLNERYQQQYQMSLQNSNFVSWADTSSGDHAPQWTSIFVCPLTGEAFSSGELLNVTHKGSKHVLDVNTATNWYGGKKNAECAAAAVAEDCFRFRLAGGADGSVTMHRFCREYPYGGAEGKSKALPTTIPSDDRDKVQGLQARARRNPYR